MGNVYTEAIWPCAIGLISRGASESRLRFVRLSGKEVLFWFLVSFSLFTQAGLRTMSISSLSIPRA